MAEIEEKQEKSPLELLRETNPGFPTDERIAAWKAQVPGGRVKLFCPDGKRIYFLRGMGGIEFSGLRKQIPQNAEDPDGEVTVLAASKCTLWTNTTPNNQVSDAELRTGTAGLPDALFAVVQNLSDFYNPSQIYTFSLEM